MCDKTTEVSFVWSVSLGRAMPFVTLMPGEDNPAVDEKLKFRQESFKLTPVFFVVCPLIDDKMKSQFVKELWIHIKLCQRYDVILSLVRGRTIKNWHQFAFYNNKSSKKKNIAVKNEENTKQFMTFLKITQCYCQ